MKLLLSFCLLGMVLSVVVTDAMPAPADPEAPFAPAAADPDAPFAPTPKCNFDAKLDCVRTNWTADCNTGTNCTAASDDEAIMAVKTERCWDDGRKYCNKNIFT